MDSILKACFIEDKDERELLRRHIYEREIDMFSQIGMNLQAIPTLWNFLSEYMKILFPANNGEGELNYDESFYFSWMKCTTCLCERMLLAYEMLSSYPLSLVACTALYMTTVGIDQH